MDVYFDQHTCIMIRYNSVWRANQELVGIQNDTAHKEQVKSYKENSASKVFSVKALICRTGYKVPKPENWQGSTAPANF